MAGEKGEVGEDEIIKGVIAGSPCDGYRLAFSDVVKWWRRGLSPRTQTTGGGQGERVLRTEMKLLGESESRRSGAGEHRRRREAGVLRGSSRREDRHAELRQRVIADTLHRVARVRERVVRQPNLSRRNWRKSRRNLGEKFKNSPLKISGKVRKKGGVLPGVIP
ncbi:hypothetical protein EAG_07143 [Camponotus floridanus]|uniref:Uncharacterized protein n=1 Tax=Camponotus floridanus TaxID=104421 RepID=E2ADC7_CAMFO|nr:hypothetical protein EAG_07143 [Camponotus floridanus]